MKERNELARAINDLPDDLLLEAEQTVRTGKVIKFRRFVAAAAVIALLSVTAGAASAGITWDKNKVSRQYLIDKFGGIYEEYYNGPESMGFEKLEITLPLEVTELPEENMEILRELTWRAGLASQGEAVDFYVRHRNGHYSIPDMPFDSFESLKDVEKLLGIKLDLPDAVRENLELGTENNWSYVWVRVYARPTGTEKTLEPAKLEIEFDLGRYAENGDADGIITLALTQEAAQEGMLVEGYSYEKEGEWWQEEATVGGYALELYGNDPQEGFDGVARAVYTSGGIGYEISARRYADIPFVSPNWPYYDTAKEMLLSVFAEGE